MGLKSRRLSLAITVLSIVYVANLLIVGGARTRLFILLLLAVFGSLVGLSLWAESHSEHPVARLLIASRGQSASTLLRFGVVMTALWMVLVYVLRSSRNSAVQTTLVWLMPFVMFPAAMGVLGGLYQLIRERFGRRRQ